jgi:hypothetical protein
MKKIVIIAALSICMSAQAGTHVGQCVFPKATMQKDGRLLSKPVEVKAAPEDKDGKVETKLWAMNVTAEKGKLVQVVDAEKHKVIGWVKFSDLDVQDLRNCTN